MRQRSSGLRGRSITWFGACLFLALGCSRDERTSKSTSPGDTAPVMLESTEALAGFSRVALAAPDAAAGTPSPAALRPKGTFYFRPTGSVLEWYVFADGLDSGRAYQVELHVDESAGYAVASLRADSSGRVGGHGTLDAFADRLCHRGDNSFPPPLSIAGPHEISVRIKDDGSPSGGNFLGRSLTSPSANAVPCTGNGDGSFEYRLFAQHAIQFRGDSTAGAR